MSQSEPSSESTEPFLRDAAPRIPSAGERIGRYTVLEPIGEGAMGVVVQAFDAELGRTVAVKVVRPMSPRSDGVDVARRRLLAEARALARISHPNVVAVYEVGLHDGLVFIAMELVDGVDLNRWLRQPRSWRDIVAAFVAAGRGLHEVHRAGLVHRDVKPANILVGRDGRVRIGDFGLARTHLSARASEGLDLVPASYDLETTGLTADGRVVGTPVYMAPEQHLGADVGPAADQYALCVGLYEALWGRRPFASTSTRLLEAKRAGPPAPPARSVPRWLFPIVARGLHPEVSRRFPSTADLCAALEGAPTRRRRRIAIAASFVAIGGAIAALATSAGPCDEPQARLSGVWDPQSRSAIEQAFADSDRPWAAPAWEHVGRSLDAYATEWMATWQQACEGAPVSGDAAPALLDRRTECLEDRARALAATTELLASGTPAAIDHAFELVARLRPIAPCGDPVALASAIELPDDAALRAAVEEVRTELGRAHALDAAGRRQDALALLRPTTARAHELGYEPLIAEALELHGNVRLRVGDIAGGRADIEQALWIAVAARHDEVALAAATNFVWIAGEKDRSLAQAMHWAGFADSFVQRRSDDATIARVRLERYVGIAHLNAAHYDEALRSFEQALHRVEGDPSAAIWTGVLHADIAQHWIDRGELGRARATLEPAISGLEPVLGRHHPRLASMRGTLAKLLDSAGEHQRAIELLEDEVESRRIADGQDSSSLAVARSNLGVLLLHAGRVDESVVLIELALATFERLGDVAGLASCVHNLGDYYFRQGIYDAAELSFSRAVTALERVYPDGHPEMSMPLIGLARVRLAQGRLDEAIAHFDRVDRIVRDAQGPWARERGGALEGKAYALAEQGRRAEALPLWIERVEIARRGSEHHPDGVPLALTQYADALCALARFEDALREADEALASASGRRMHRRIALAQLARACALRGLRRDDDARTAVRAAVEAAERGGPTSADVLADAKTRMTELATSP